MGESRTEIPYAGGHPVVLLIIQHERHCEIASKLMVSGHIDQYVQFPRALAPQVAAALWPEVVEVLQKLLPIAERMQHACDSGETYCCDNDWDMAESMHYEQIIAECQALMAALKPGEDRGDDCAEISVVPKGR